MLRLALALVAMVAVMVHATRAEQNKYLIIVVLDNSAALQGVDLAEGLKKQLLFQVTELRKKSELRQAAVRIVSVNNPRVLWSGTPMELFRNGGALLSRIGVVKNGCADILGALDHVRLIIELEQPVRVDLYVFSSLIHTGSPCDKVSITLPQPAPEQLDLSFLSNEKTRIRFYFVHHLQLRPWHEMLKRIGLKNASIHDEESTRALLQKGLAP